MNVPNGSMPGPRDTTAAAVIIFCYGLLTVVALIPILTVHHPPLQDYANHLARMYILANPADLFVQQHWLVEWRFVPNLAMDLIVPMLAKVVPLATAGKVFICVSVVLVTSGAMALHFVIYRRLAVLPLLCFSIVPNLAFQKGFLNFTFGIALMMWAIAGWIAFQARHPILRWCYGALAAVLLLVMHLHAYGVFCLFIAAFEAAPLFLPNGKARRLDAGRTVLVLSSLLPAAVALAFFSPTASASAKIEYGSFLDRLNIAHYLFPPPVHWRLDWLFSAAIVSIVLWALTSRVVRTQLRPAAGILVLLFTYFAVPETIITATNVSWRTLIPLSFLFLATIEIEREIDRTWRGLVGISCAVFLFVAMRFTTIASAWIAADRSYIAASQLLHELPKGKRVASIIRNISYSDAVLRRALLHITAYGVIEHQLFVPILFAFPTQQPLRYRPPYDRVADSTLHDTFYEAGDVIDCDAIQREIDYVVLWDGSQPREFPCGLSLVRRSGDAFLLSVSMNDPAQSNSISGSSIDSPFDRASAAPGIRAK